jgi:hypothetical protein
VRPAAGDVKIGRMDKAPKWLGRPGYALAVVLLVVGVLYIGKAFGGRTGQALQGSALVALGLAFFWQGATGREFFWGEQGEGGPAPRAVGAALFIFVALVFIVTGIAVLFGLVHVNE